jgi:hypothetical protein
MDFQPFECVVLNRDLAEHGLKTGDLGAIVDLYEPDALEIEFVTAGGHTQALLTLRTSDVRKVEPRDMVAVRPVQPAA